MPRRRIVLKRETAVYHVVNRLVRKEFWLDEEAREVFVNMLRKQARFTGVEVLTYCIMSNHFHLLLRVPPSALEAHKRGEGLIDDATLLERYRGFYGKRNPLDFYSADELEQLLQGGGNVAEAARQRVLARMGDLSVFMQELKHRFMIWFNRTRNNEGTIWSAKFKSSLLEDTVEIRSAVAAYIDLNPVRARITDDSEEYRWSGYGAAVKEHSETARIGLRQVFACASTTSESWGETFRLYRRMLFSIGLGGRERADGGNAGTVNPEKAEAILSGSFDDRGGSVSIARKVAQSVGGFLSSAKAIGSGKFITQITAAAKADNPEKKRQDKARILPGISREKVCAWGRRRRRA